MSDTHKERHSALRGESQERLDLRTTYELLDLSTAPILARTGTGSGLLAPVHWYGCISVNNNNGRLVEAGGSRGAGERRLD